jgi:hypothetical protein
VRDTRRLSPGAWVKVHRIYLPAGERAPEVPADTATVPFEAWINGHLVEEAELGGWARVRTLAGRIVEGQVVEEAPGYTHSFGSPPRALQRASARARDLLFGRGR